MQPDINQLNQGVMPERPVTPENMDKIGEQKESQTEGTSITDQAMQMMDMGMSELSESPNPIESIKSLIEQLKTLLPIEDNSMDNSY
jgi:hypothetical protein